MKVLSHKNGFYRDCERCNARLEFEPSDVQTGEFGCGYIVCPECGHKIYLDDPKFDKKVTHDNIKFPKDFWHMDKNAVEISDEEIQRWVSEVAQALKNGDEYCSTGSGNTMVVGQHYEDEDYIYVFKNYYEGQIYLDWD